MHRSKASWFREYSLFLESLRWQAVRREVLARDGYRCAYCQAPARQVHHLSYFRLDEPALLVSVCAVCHSLLHRRALTYPRARRSRPSNSWKRWLVRLFRIIK
jgi:5-methylcytosine-specific restriction endonuclease McrA